MSDTDLHSQIERLLGRLKPVPPTLDRDHFLFEAGEAAGQRSVRAKLMVPVGAAFIIGGGLGLLAGMALA